MSSKDWESLGPVDQNDPRVMVYDQMSLGYDDQQEARHSTAREI